jgi:hypothetical protein
MTDFVSANGINLYRINRLEDQDTVITITVYEGNPTATIKDFTNNIVKTKSKIGNSIHFNVHLSKSA